MQLWQNLTFKWKWRSASRLMANVPRVQGTELTNRNSGGATVFSMDVLETGHRAASLSSRSSVTPKNLPHSCTVYHYPDGKRGHSSMARSSFNPKPSFQSILFRELPALDETLCSFLTWVQWIFWFLIKVTVDDSHLISIRYIIIIIDFFTRIVNVLAFLMWINYRSKVRNVY